MPLLHGTGMWIRYIGKRKLTGAACGRSLLIREATVLSTLKSGLELRPANEGVIEALDLGNLM